MPTIFLSVARPLLASLALTACLGASLAAQAPAEHARTRWERLCQIRRDQFDLILPLALRDHGVDMWIVMQKENQFDRIRDHRARQKLFVIASRRFRP